MRFTKSSFFRDAESFSKNTTFPIIVTNKSNLYVTILTNIESIKEK